MKTLLMIKQIMLIAIFSAGTITVLQAQNPEKRPGQNNQPGRQTQPGLQDQNQTPVDQDRRQSIQSGQPGNMNKASHFVGMAVKNQNGERLGMVRDIVFDVDSGRLVYAVFVPEQGEKMHAVPLNAFQASPDGHSIILNADKDKLMRAEGFGPNEWPSIKDPSWGADPFWRTNPGIENRDPFKDPNRDSIRGSSTAPKKPAQPRDPSTPPR